MHEHAHVRLEARRPNRHSTNSDGTPRRGGRPTTTVARGSTGRNRAAAITASTTSSNTQVDSLTTSSNASPIATTSAIPSLPIVMSSSRASASSLTSASTSKSTLSSAAASSSRSNGLANAEESSAAPKSTTPNNANKYIPAILASIFVVLAAVILVFCLHRRRKLARKRDALTSLAPSPYKLDGLSDESIDDKGYPYNDDQDNKQHYGDLKNSQHYLSQDPASAQTNFAGRPRSFLETIRNTFLGRKATRSQAPAANLHPWDWQASNNANRPESPPIQKVPVMTQVPSTTQDPFRDGFGPGASQLATGLANTTMTSQLSTDSHSSLSHKQSLSSNASTSVARRWPNGVSRDGHESLSQGPNVRTLYSGIQVEGTAEEEENPFDEAYADAYAYDGNSREELAVQHTPSVRQAGSIRTVSQSSRADEQGRHLSQSTDGGQGRSIRFGTLKSYSDSGQELFEPAWQRA